MFYFCNPNYVFGLGLPQQRSASLLSSLSLLYSFSSMPTLSNTYRSTKQKNLASRNDHVLLFQHFLELLQHPVRVLLSSALLSSQFAIIQLWTLVTSRASPSFFGTAYTWFVSPSVSWFFAPIILANRLQLSEGQGSLFLCYAQIHYKSHRKTVLKQSFWCIPHMSVAADMYIHSKIFNVTTDNGIGKRIKNSGK